MHGTAHAVSIRTLRIVGNHGDYTRQVVAEIKLGSGEARSSLYSITITYGRAWFRGEERRPVMMKIGCASHRAVEWITSFPLNFRNANGRAGGLQTHTLYKLAPGFLTALGALFDGDALTSLDRADR